MKTGNFPGMKTERRNGALERIEKKLDAIKEIGDAEIVLLDDKFVPVGLVRRRLIAEADTLRLRVGNVTWFTKKHRGG